MKLKIGNKRIKLNVLLSSNTDKQLNEYKNFFQRKNWRQTLQVYI